MSACEADRGCGVVLSVGGCAATKEKGQRVAAERGSASTVSKNAAPAKETRAARATATADAAAAASSKFFQRQRERARKLLNDPEALRRVAEDANRSGALRSGPFAAVLEDFRALIRLVVAYTRGHYRSVPVESLVVIVAGLLYVLSPIDVVPDAIPGVGFLDDAAVIGWVLKTVRGELEAFREWELGSESDI